MSYQVLARKWRPRSFASLVGQEHVVRALRHALESNRLHHAYLFTGTRGVGKTTLARILATCLNCESGVTAEPCGRCTACVEIEGGRFVDLLEVDAATNTRVDEMRQLLETAQYAPVRGRYKVYVIDEVHMLSTSAFNAMLKTLEEPPEHLKFVLATTDPQKIPVTVLSRCLQFNLKQMPRDAIVSHLAKVLEAEGIQFEPGALPLIGRAAAGSMRDALSLLDQAIAHGGGQIVVESVRGMLGAVDETYVLRLLDAVADGDAKAAADVADELLTRSLSFDTALADTAAVLLRVALAQQAPDALGNDVPARDHILRLARQLEADRVQLCYQIALQGRKDLALAPDEYSGFLMTALRMIAFEFEDTGLPASSPATAAAARGEKVERQPVPDAAAAGGWAELVAGMSISGAARELARNAERRGEAGDSFDLVVPKAMAHLAGKPYQDKLKSALEQHLGRAVTVKVSVGETAGVSMAAREMRERDRREAQAAETVRADPFVQDLVNIFDGKIVGTRHRETPPSRDV